MALVPGVESYITIEQMNQYVQTHYTSTDSLRISWEALEVEDQEVHLRKAFATINSLPFTGRRYHRNQILPFPRSIWLMGDAERVENAQAIIAIHTTLSEINNELDTVMLMQLRGLRSIRLGDASYGFGAPGGTIPSNANYFNLPKAAYDLLSKWLTGGFNICSGYR